MRSFLSHPVIVLLFIVLAIVFYISLDQSSQRAVNSKQEIQQLENEIAHTQNEVSKLESELKIAEHPITVEKVIRDQLLMQKENEYVFQLPEIEVIEKKPTPEIERTPWEEWREVLF